MFTITIDGLEEVLRRVVQEELAAHTVGDEWLDSTDAAEYLGISRGHLHNLRKTVPSHKVGGRRRYRRSELDGYQEGGRA